MKVGFIGAGKVGFSLGKYFATGGILLSGYFSKTSASAKDAAAFTDSQSFSSVDALIAESDILFITVPDAAIRQVWQEIRGYSISGKTICHCSGAQSSRIFDGIEGLGAYGCSLHPIYAVHDKYSAYKDFSGIHFSVEGDPRGVKTVGSLIAPLGNVIGEIEAEKKTLYHAASVVVSNLVVGLAKTGSDLFSACGFDEEFSRRAWHSLFLGNAENICSVGPVAALTGPVERGDADTVRRHLEALEEPNRELYRMLSLNLLNIAKAKHPHRDFAALEKELVK